MTFESDCTASTYSLGIIKFLWILLQNYVFLWGGVNICEDSVTLPSFMRNLSIMNFWSFNNIEEIKDLADDRKKEK